MLCNFYSTPQVFQSTLPHGSDYDKSSSFYCLRDFNPRSLTGATFLLLLVSVDSLISIHAPSRERPRAYAGRYDDLAISIHAPSRERHDFKIIRTPHNYFNPRSLTGATSRTGDYGNFSVISIHAPSRERPSSLSLKDAIFIISIHAPSRERPLVKLTTFLAARFQSTLPHGSDLDLHYNLLLEIYFNPRSLTGATSFGVPWDLLLEFQSTLPHGSDAID